MKNRRGEGRGSFLPIEFRVLTADRRSVAISFPCLLFILLRSNFFRKSRGTKERRERREGGSEEAAALSPLFRLFEFVERVRFCVYFRARVDVSRGWREREREGGEETRSHVNGRYYYARLVHPS